jgi:hydrogenase/urease accessory protein HupE
MPPSLRHWPAVSAFILLLLAVPQPAYAHGVAGGAETAPGFIWVGMQHMLLGWDHLLFVGGVALLAGTARRAATFISLFALGHSITLIIATLAEWRVNATLVDIAVALSLVFVGAVGVVGRPKDWRWFGAAVFGFGLVHGVGLATRLQDLDLPADGVLSRVLFFNLGVELGQLAALLVMAGAVRLLGSVRPSPQRIRLAYGALIATGIVAAGVLAVLEVTANEEPAQAKSANCQVRERTDTYPGGGGHPPKDFYEPGEEAPAKAFGHVVGDGFVIVHYNPNLPADQLAQLRAYVNDKASGKVVGGPDPAQTEPVKAVHAYRTELVCSAFDLGAVQEFSKTWFADPRSKSAS